MTNRSRDLQAELESQPASPVPQLIEIPANPDPVVNFYRHKAKTNLPVFYRLALQTGSLHIRDMFSKVASKQCLDLSSLLAATSHYLSHTTPQLQEETQTDFDSSILLALADLLANTARDDFDTHSAVQLYEFTSIIHGDHLFSDQNKLQFIEALSELHRFEESQRLAHQWDINQIAPLQQELLNLQRIRRTGSSSDEWVATLNELYLFFGMTPVELSPNESLPLMDRLSAGTRQPIDGPKISVIMPTYSPGPGIKTAIRGLLDQTWQNIEIIIVDDASPNEFRDVFQEVAQLDSRIRVIHQDSNQGAYVARNAGLAVATGSFITTHDDDDWSHPDKLAAQVEILLRHDEVVATTSAHIRTTEQLEFRRVNAKAQFLQMNYSSLMFRSSVVQEVGSWDTVNRGGDSEFYTRLKEIFGAERIVGIHDRPFSFSRVWDGSLTSGEMSRGFFAYSRLLYRWAFRQWYWDVKKLDHFPVRAEGDPRPYAIPTTFEAGQRNLDLGSFDVIYATDFFRQAPYANRVVHEMEALADSGLRVGYMHLYSPRTTKPEGFPQRLFDLQLEDRITEVSYNNIAQTRLLLVFDASIGMFLDQLQSTVNSERGVIIAHEPPGLSGARKRSSAAPHSAMRNFDRCFRTSFEIVGATRKDQERLRKAVPPKRVLSEACIWGLTIHGGLGEITPPSGVPIVGFHSYGNHYRWPSSLSEFHSVYFSDRFVTRFYGNVQKVRNKFGPSSFDFAEIATFSGSNEQDFLDSIDFWVYYPHKRLIDEVWPPVLKAMQAGKVVILPHRLQELYGPAAVYSEPEEVELIVASLASDISAYREQAKLGQAFVEERASSRALIKRVENLI